MSFIDLIVLGIALSMDAFAVTISDAFAYKGSSRLRLMLLPVAFGLFQGLMPALGYLLGSVFGQVIEDYSGIVSFVILGIIGAGMIKEGVLALRSGEGEGEGASGGRLGFVAILTQAVATSIDAFAVGVSLRAMGADVLLSSCVIAATTLLICFAALGLGRRFGVLLGDRAQVVGGAVLVAIGLKALLF